MNCELENANTFLKKYDMHLGHNKTVNGKLLKQLNRNSLVARSMRCVYQVDNFIIKTSSDATGFKLPIGADQCLNEFNIYNSTDKELKEFKKILCPVYAIYESKFLYLTVHKLLTPLAKNDDSDETIYDYIRDREKFINTDIFLSVLDKFKRNWVTCEPKLQNEYSKISTFGYDKNNYLYVLDYGML